MASPTTPSMTRPPSEAPPATSVGILGWLKENLFGSVANTLITLLSAYLLFVLLRLLLRFVLFEADWTVVTTNLTLFAIGQYPREQAWRPALALALVIALGITSLLLWRWSDIRRWLLVLWLLSVPAVSLLLAGLPGIATLPPVRTSLWSGLLLTMVLTVVGIVTSFPLGVLLALGRRSDLPIIKVLCIVVIETFRGVPLISVLFLAQVMLPLFLGFSIDTLLRAMAAITLFVAAYIAEIVRGGLQAIPKGQIEAAQALGLNPVLVTGLIVLPQALRIVIPAIVGQFISLFKDTSLVSIVTLLDLIGITDAALNQRPEFQFHKMEAYLFVGLIYFVISAGLSEAARRIERNTAQMGGTRRL